MLTQHEFISTSDLLPSEPNPSGVGPPLQPAVPESSDSPLTDVQRDLIVRTLENVDGNKAAAARALRVSRRALYRYLERHGLHTPMHESQAAQRRSELFGRRAVRQPRGGVREGAHHYSVLQPTGPNSPEVEGRVPNSAVPALLE